MLIVFFKLQNLAFHVDGDLRGEIALGDGRGHVGDVADLAGEIGGHEVDVVGEILPGAGHARHLRPGRRACLRCRPRAPRGVTSRGEAVELIDHRVDGVLQLENLALHLDGDLAATGRRLATAVVTSAMLRTWPVRLVAIELTLSVRSFQVPATPCTCGLAAELAFGADLARHASDFARRSR